MKMAAATAIEVNGRPHVGRILADEGERVLAAGGLPDDDVVRSLRDHVVDGLANVGCPTVFLEIPGNACSSPHQGRLGKARSLGRLRWVYVRGWDEARPFGHNKAAAHQSVVFSRLNFGTQFRLRGTGSVQADMANGRERGPCIRFDEAAPSSQPGAGLLALEAGR